MPKISIIMSLYNPDYEYLKECLDSIAAQTYQDFELILINDGCSEEKLQKVLETYHFNTIIINNPENLGLAKSLNKGIDKANGEYIARIDDDDIMEPHRLEVQLKYMEDHSDVGATVSNYKIIDAQGNVIESIVGDRNKKIKKFLINRGNCLCHSSLFMRTSVARELNGYDGKLYYAQDYDLYLRMIEKYDIYEIPQCLVRFRRSTVRSSAEKSIFSILCASYGRWCYMKRNHKASPFSIIMSSMLLSVTMYRILKNNNT